MTRFKWESSKESQAANKQSSYRLNCNYTARLQSRFIYRIRHVDFEEITGFEWNSNKEAQK